MKINLDNKQFKILTNSENRNFNKLRGLRMRVCVLGSRTKQTAPYCSSWINSTWALCMRSPCT
jgi:hypothetical protein